MQGYAGEPEPEPPTFRERFPHGRILPGHHLGHTAVHANILQAFALCVDTPSAVRLGRTSPSHLELQEQAVHIRVEARERIARGVCGERNSSCSSSVRSSGKMPAMAWCQAVRKYVMLPPYGLPPADFAAAASRFPGPLGPPEPLDLRRAAFYARREEHAHVEAQAFMTLRRFQVPVEEMTDEDFAN